MLQKNEISHFSTIFRIVGGLILLLNLVSDFLLYLKQLTRESLSKTHKRPEVKIIFTSCQNLSSVLHKTKSKVHEIADFWCTEALIYISCLHAEDWPQTGLPCCQRLVWCLWSYINFSPTFTQLGILLLFSWFSFAATILKSPYLKIEDVSRWVTVLNSA